MKKKFGAMAALAALTTQAGLPDAALAQELRNLTEQCDYIMDIRNDRSALQRELELLLNRSPDALSCTMPIDPELRAVCQEQCVGLIVSLLGGDPLAELPPGIVDPY